MRIAILDDYQMVGHEYGEFDLIPGAQVTTFGDHIVGDAALARRLAPFEAIVAMRERTPFPRALLEQLPNLKILVSTGVSNPSIDDVAAKELGILLCNTGGHATSTAELTFGLLIALTRNLQPEEAAVVSGGWQSLIGPALGGNTLGILGLGKLGQKVALVANAFDMNVLAWSQNLTAETAKAAGATLVTKDELFQQSDFVTIHMRLSDRTLGLVGEHELELLGPNGYLINTSRGPIVHEQALLAALENDTIGGAGLDVFDVEPLPFNHPYRSAPRLLVTPHIGYVTIDGYRTMYANARENIQAYIDGKPIRVVNG